MEGTVYSLFLPASLYLHLYREVWCGVGGWGGGVGGGAAFSKIAFLPSFHPILLPSVFPSVLPFFLSFFLSLLLSSYSSFLISRHYPSVRPSFIRPSFPPFVFRLSFLLFEGANCRSHHSCDAKRLIQGIY